MPRSTLAIVVSEQLRKMSVAFVLHGEIVPLRGVTKKCAASRGPSAFSSVAALSRSTCDGSSPSAAMA